MSEVVVNEPLRNIEGVKPEVSQKIYKILKKGRRYFGSSGASLTHQAYSPEYENVEAINREVVKDNLDAEREITEFLKKWSKDKPNVVLIDSATIPEGDDDEEETLNPEIGMYEENDTDHILIIGNEVIFIDTKRWKKKKTYTVSDDGQALMTNKEFPGGSVTLNKKIMNWLNYLEEDAVLTAIVCVKNEETTVIRNKNWYTNSYYRLVEFDRFEELLDEKWKTIEDYDKTHISSTFVSQVVVKCIKPFDLYSKVFDMQSLRDFK